MRWHTSGILILIFVMIGLTGCESEEEGRDVILDPNVSHTITVMDDKDFFMNKFGKIITAKHPNVQFQFVTPPVPEKGEDRIEALTKFMRQSKPDILKLGFNTFRQLTDKGELLDLAPFIKTDKYDIEVFHPAVIELLRGMKPDQLYGLSSYFVKNGLFYNKELFDRYKVNYPVDSMTWEDVSLLARKFPLKRADHDNLVGVYIDDLFGGDPNLYADRMFHLGSFERAAILNDQGTALRMNDPKWKSIWGFLQTNFRAGVFEKALEPDKKIDLFATGKAAMAFAPNVYVQTLERNMSTEWGVVTEPISKGKQDQSYSVSVREVYSISAGSSAASTSWELLKFMHSEEVTQLLAQSSVYGNLLSTRESAPRVRGQVDNSVFYKLNRWFEPPREKITPLFLDKFIQLAEQELIKVIEQDKSIDQALNDLQESAQDAL